LSSLSVHNLDPETEGRLRERADRAGKSVSQTARELLSEAVGATQDKKPARKADFTRFAGLWSDDDLREFERTAADLRETRPEDWR